MRLATMQIKSSLNALIPLPEETKYFDWDMDECDYSEEAFNYIQLLMTMQRAFTVRTTEARDYSKKRAEIVFGKVVAWIGRHKLDDDDYGSPLVFTSQEDAEKWRGQYKKGYAWLDELIVKPDVKLTDSALLRRRA